MAFNTTSIYSSTIDNNISSSDTGGLPSLLIGFLSLQQIVFVVACSGNLFVICVVLRFMNLKDNSNVFVLNLAIADFFTGISSGVQIFFVFYRHLNLNIGTCLLRFQIVGSMTVASQVTVFLLSVDRYIAICHHDLYKKILTKKLSFIIVTLPWIICFSISLPTFLGWNNWGTGIRCSYSLVFPSAYFWTTALTVCLLNFFSCFAHLLIFIQIRKFHKRVKPLMQLGNDDKKMQKNIKSAKVMLFITIAFTVCWIPYMTFPFAYANGYVKNTNLKEASSWLVFIGMLNSVINPFIYAWYKQDFRRACKKACKCCYLNL